MIVRACWLFIISSFFSGMKGVHNLLLSSLLKLFGSFTILITSQITLSQLLEDLIYICLQIDICVIGVVEMFCYCWLFSFYILYRSYKLMLNNLPACPLYFLSHEHAILYMPGLVSRRDGSYITHSWQSANFVGDSFYITYFYLVHSILYWILLSFLILRWYALLKCILYTCSL